MRSKDSKDELVLVEASPQNAEEALENFRRQLDIAIPDNADHERAIIMLEQVRHAVVVMKRERDGAFHELAKLESALEDYLWSDDERVTRLVEEVEEQTEEAAIEMAMDAAQGMAAEIMTDNLAEALAIALEYDVYTSKGLVRELAEALQDASKLTTSKTAKELLAELVRKLSGEDDDG